MKKESEHYQYMITRIHELEQQNKRLKEWLWQYREELKSTNVFHKNQGIINAIDKLLP